MKKIEKGGGRKSFSQKGIGHLKKKGSGQPPGELMMGERQQKKQDRKRDQKSFRKKSGGGFNGGKEPN